MKTDKRANHAKGIKRSLLGLSKLKEDQFPSTYNLTVYLRDCFRILMTSGNFVKTSLAVPVSVAIAEAHQ